MSLVYGINNSSSKESRKAKSSQQNTGRPGKVASPRDRQSFDIDGPACPEEHARVRLRHAMSRVLGIGWSA